MRWLKKWNAFIFFLNYWKSIFRSKFHFFWHVNKYTSLFLAGVLMKNCLKNPTSIIFRLNSYLSSKPDILKCKKKHIRRYEDWKIRTLNEMWEELSDKVQKQEFFLFNILKCFKGLLIKMLKKKFKHLKNLRTFLPEN